MLVSFNGTIVNFGGYSLDYTTSQYSLVTSGLTMYLDSGNQLSYPSTGSTWYDLTDVGKLTTLYNTPTYTNGILKFSDTSGEYAETNLSFESLSVWTVEVWVRFNASLVGKCTSVMSGVFNGSVLNFSIGTNNFPTNSKIAVGFYNGSWRTNAGFDPSLNVWYHIVGTYDGSIIKQYVNGSLSGGTLNYVGTPTSGGKVRVASRWDSQIIPTDFLGGEVPIVRIYNRALLSDEVRQNFNATKSRYGY